MSEQSSDDLPQSVQSDPRWPMVAAVLAGLALTILRPTELRVTPVWVLPLVELLLLAALIARDPGRIDKRSTVLRVVSLSVVGILVVDALVATGHLVTVLIHGGNTTNSAEDLLAAGAVVWVSNVIAFALLYWDLDSGGAAARAHRMQRTPDLAFPQHLSPEIAPPGWRPRFTDYLYLAELRRGEIEPGLTASTAFSPTDVMPLCAMGQSRHGCTVADSLVVLGLVVARGVNVLT